MTTLNIIEIAIGIAFIYAILVGYFRGLILMVARVVAMVASYLGAGVIANLLKDSVGQQFLLPLLNRQVSGGIFESMAKAALVDTAEGIAYSILFFISFIVLEIILIRLVNLLKIVDHIPVVGKLNKLGGAVAGFFWMFFLFLIVGNLVFNFLPQEILDQIGMTKKALQDTIFLNLFLS